jgi:hypothetical protein
VALARIEDDPDGDTAMICFDQRLQNHRLG